MRGAFVLRIQKHVSQINYMAIIYCEYSMLNDMTHSKIV